MCFQHTALDRIALAAFFFVQDDQVGVLARIVLRDLHGAVGTAILHQEDFAGVLLTIEKLKYPLQGSRQAAFFVIGWDDDGQEGRVQTGLLIEIEKDPGSGDDHTDLNQNHSGQEDDLSPAQTKVLFSGWRSGHW